MDSPAAPAPVPAAPVGEREAEGAQGPDEAAYGAATARRVEVAIESVRGKYALSMLFFLLKHSQENYTSAASQREARLTIHLVEAACSSAFSHRR